MISWLTLTTKSMFSSLIYIFDAVCVLVHLHVCQARWLLFKYKIFLFLCYNELVSSFKFSKFKLLFYFSNRGEKEASNYMRNFELYHFNSDVIINQMLFYYHFKKITTLISYNSTESDATQKLKCQSAIRTFLFSLISNKLTFFYCLSPLNFTLNSLIYFVFNLYTHM
jgi:hypothetical protein